MEILTPSDYQSRRRQRPRRSSRPCDACRKRKTRCLAQEGSDRCAHCKLRGSACTFQQDPPERHPSGRLSTSRQTSRPVRNPVDPTDEQLSVPETQSPERPQLQPVATTPSEARHETQDSPSPSAVSDFTPDASTLGLAHSRFAELYGLGSDMEPILMRHRPYDPFTHEFNLVTHSIRRVLERDAGAVDYPLTFHMVSDEKALDFDAGHAQVDAIEALVRPNGPSLVELFWRHVQPCYPLLHKAFFMQNYSRSYRHVSAALLGAVYLSALRWWSYDPELSIRPMPDAAMLRKLLHQAISSSYHRPKLSSIQAILLLLQCQPEDPLNPDHTYDWGLTCQALAIGQCLGLHLDATEWSIPLWERNVRKRLSWALYMQDRWTALAYGRPVHIHYEDWSVQELTSLDFADCDSSGNNDDERRSISATGKMQFILMVRLTQILSSVLGSFYTQRTCFEQDTVLLYQRAQPVLEQLREWYQCIPSSLQMNVTYHRKLSFHGYLHFSYYGVMITVLRRLIRSTALPPRCTDIQTLSEIRQLALQTVQSAIGFTMNLRPDQLEAFWYFTTPYLFALVGSFTTLLLVTSLSSQERSFWQDTLNSYLWNLRMQSKSSEPMRYAVNRLEGAILRGLEHALAVNLNEPINDAISPALANSFPTNEAFEFTDFGDWDLATGVNGAFDLLSAALQMDPDPMIGASSIDGAG